MNESETSEMPSGPEGTSQPIWNTPLPAVIPEPSYVPGALALGIALGAWGALTHWVMAAVGGILVVWALTHWMRELRTFWEHTDE